MLQNIIFNINGFSEYCDFENDLLNEANDYINSCDLIVILKLIDH